MLLSAMSVLVVALSSSEIPEGLMNNPVLDKHIGMTDVKMKFINVYNRILLDA
jgi:hypothetical protein